MEATLTQRALYLCPNRERSGPRNISAEGDGRSYSRQFFAEQLEERRERIHLNIMARMIKLKGD